MPDGAIEIRPNDEITKSPDETIVYLFDWGRLRLATAVQIDDSTFTIARIKPSGTGTLAKDDETTLTGGRKTWLRLQAGASGETYEVRNTVTTNESPTQTFSAAFRLKIE